jgi:hypothetical protein
MCTDSCMEIRTIAERVRRFLEDSQRRNELPPAMAEFPAGACSPSVNLLGRYLAECNYDGFAYVSAERGSLDDDTWTSHAWLARGECVVDITSDQFEDGAGPVVVGRSEWHKQFAIEIREMRDFERETRLDQTETLYRSIVTYCSEPEM